MDLRLKGKTVLITGASKGIGAACAHSFAAEGCNLQLVARNAALLENLARDLVQRHHVTVAIRPADLRDGKALEAVAREGASADILINNAGDIPGGTLASLDELKWRHAWELKVFGYINLSRLVHANMVARGSGVIVNVIGMAAEKPSYEYICGATANAGLAAFTKALGKGPDQARVRVMGVHPPSTKTERIAQVMAGAAQARYGDASRTDHLIRDGVFSQPIDPEQVADAVTYLASPRASQLSGIVLNLG
jgi:short-subunit dehydrogenase